MSYYPESDSHIRDKVKVVLRHDKLCDQKNFSHVKGVDTSDLAAKIRFCCFESWNWWTSHLVNVPTSLNNLKTKVDDLDTGKLITLVDLKEIRLLLKICFIISCTSFMIMFGQGRKNTWWKKVKEALSQIAVKLEILCYL